MTPIWGNGMTAETTNIGDTAMYRNLKFWSLL